ncbi:MAG: CsgG/HfaB family protein [Bacteroidales bacterium]|nr:CsgG/HfaB family protein [Bacteroidales bacterium]
MKKSFITAFIFIWIIFSGYSQSFTAYMLVAPDVYLEDVHKISILDFDGRMGAEMTDYLVAELIQEFRGTGGKSGGNYFSAGKSINNFQKGARTNVFSLVERSELDKVLREQNISNSGLIDDSQAAQIGKLLGIDAMITGSVAYSHQDEQKTLTYTDLNGNKKYSYCTTRTVTAEGHLKIINVNTGQIIGTTVKTTSYSDKKCDDKRSTLFSVEELAKVCYDGLATKLANYFTPVFLPMEYEFEKIKDKEYKEKGKLAMDYLESGDLNNAFSIYKSIYDIDPYNTAASSNIARLYRMTGNYEKAQEYYALAAEVDEVTYSSLVQAAKKEMEMLKIFEGYGINIEQNDFIQKSDALAERVTTRGNKSDKYDVRVNPDQTSDVVAKVPGSTEFTVIEKQGEYYLIKLLGGKQGYIHDDYVK